MEEQILQVLHFQAAYRNKRGKVALRNMGEREQDVPSGRQAGPSHSIYAISGYEELSQIVGATGAWECHGQIHLVAQKPAGPMFCQVCPKTSIHNGVRAGRLSCSGSVPAPRTGSARKIYPKNIQQPRFDSYAFCPKLPVSGLFPLAEMARGWISTGFGQCVWSSCKSRSIPGFGQTRATSGRARPNVGPKRSKHGRFGAILADDGRCCPKLERAWPEIGPRPTQIWTSSTGSGPLHSKNVCER